MKASILSSDRSHVWNLADPLESDVFAWEKEGSAALLLLAMHVTDPRPWTCARNPVSLRHEPGLIDRDTKRILGKRFRQAEPEISLPCEPLDPFQILMAKLKPVHSFEDPNIVWPEFEKKPGFLLPRRLTARANITVDKRRFSLYSRNFSEISQALHAEVTLLFALASQITEPRIDSFQLHTTLKPCKMCAAFLHGLKVYCDSFEVTFDEDDPGPLAANTLLDQFGYKTTLPNS